MDKNKEKCDSIGLKYKQKYDKLLSLVNGYENQNITVSKEQQKNMKQLSDIISNTKELLSEGDFTKLRNEQDNIMKEFYHLENVKNDNPYSNNALEFTNNSDIIDESMNISEQSEQNNNTLEQNNNTLEQNDSDKSKSAIEKVKNIFSLDSFENINKKTNNLSETTKNETQITKNETETITNEVRKDLERNDIRVNNSIETRSDIQERRNDILNTRIDKQTPSSMIQTRPVNMPMNMPQPCYPNKPNFIGLPSIQIVNVESSCQSKKRTTPKYKKSKKIYKTKKPNKQEPIRRVQSKRKRKTKKEGPKCHRENYVPTFKDKSNNHKIF